ncbi:efflux RND transporter periplasmic adaptor subunit [Tissierella sp.]|uniref:efflux RND transporter periplasmic adaptor subunit n=1 Tax=Tissierella sp. TaxID=41274 RepID=UPI0028A870F2|nr:efflux RND transporter periplasmic adaptor subunit [Tissierella sp.]
MEKNLSIRKYKNIIVFLAILFLGTIIYKKQILKSFIEPKENIKKTNIIIEEDLGIPIETDKIIKEVIVEKLNYIGTIYPKDTVELSFKMPAEIIQLNIKEGEHIKAGDIIGRLDDSNIHAKLDTIQAKLKTIELNINYLSQEESKYRELLDNGAIPQNAYDKIKHEKDIAEMQLKELESTKIELELSLRDFVLISPIDGIVKNLNASIGEIALTGKPVALIDTEESIVKVNIGEMDLDKVKKDMEVNLALIGIENKINAKVTKIMPSINPATRIGEVEIANINGQFISGTSVEVEFIISKVDEGLTMPLNAIKELKDTSVVYKIVDNHVEEIPIKTGIKVNNRLQIIEGLEEGDIIAIKNLNKLYDDAKVTIFKGEIK